MTASMAIKRALGPGNFRNRGSVGGIIAALNRVLELTVPSKMLQEGGTFVIPGHGRISDEHDVLMYRDMLVIVRDRIQDLVSRKMTLDQVKAARVTRDYDGRYAAASGASTADRFVEAIYRELTASAASAARGSR